MRGAEHRAIVQPVRTLDGLHRDCQGFSLNEAAFGDEQVLGMGFAIHRKDTREEQRG